MYTSHFAFSLLVNTFLGIHLIYNHLWTAHITALRSKAKKVLGLILLTILQALAAPLSQNPIIM